MTDISNPTGSIPPVGARGGTTVVDLDAPVIPAANERVERPSVDSTPRHNPLDDIHPERPRTHPVAYAALALSALALLLSVLAMSRGGDDGYRQVKIGNNDCVIGQQAGADVLYCRAANVP